MSHGLPLQGLVTRAPWVRAVWVGTGQIVAGELITVSLDINGLGVEATVWVHGDGVEELEECPVMPGIYDFEGQYSTFELSDLTIDGKAYAVRPLPPSHHHPPTHPSTPHAHAHRREGEHAHYLVLPACAMQGSSSSHVPPV